MDTALPKIRRRLIPFLFLLYIIAYLDRVNVGFAALQMNADLGFSATVYGLGSGVFFLSYTAFEVPSNLILARVGARVWIARIMFTWGLASSAMLFVSDAASFYLLRFVLGAAEAGFFPGIIYYLTHWFPARERAHAVALFMTATAMAGVVGGPLSSGLLALDGALGLRGWQWLFLVEGLPAVLLAPVVLRHLTERPADATWLTPAERQAVTAAIAQEHASTPPTSKFRDVLVQPTLWVLSGVYFLLVMGFYGIGFWLPTILQSAGDLGPSAVASISALPYVAAAVAMVFVGRHSDAAGERRWHVALPLATGAVGFLVATQAGASVPLALGALSLAALGIWGALGPFWALPTAGLHGAAAAGGIAIVNSVGNVGGFVGPFLVGYVRDATGSFSAGLLLLAGGLLAGGALALALPRR
ncbi:MAG: MFS transporter [Acidobacteriota bacterium]